ncbi:TPA_asm: hypothetical protein vir521_00031 [Caudoviricetes sp. vir521]|nr:TPA_asm: hypothetical protein vir521_00031 [Caudoviricetes sp. vir521]
MTDFEKAQKNAVDLGTNLAHNGNLRFRKLEVKGAWVWAIPKDAQTEAFLKRRGFFPNPKFEDWFCYAFIALKKRSTADSISQIERRYGNLTLEEVA